MPGVTERVRRKLRERNCSFTAVANEIAQDAVVAASVLRAANSPLYRGAECVTTLQSAVARLGTRALRTLMMHQAMHAVTFEGKGDNRRLAEILWRRALASAHIMHGLAQFTSVDREEAFVIGLLHDVGNVVVLRVARDQRALTRSEVDWEAFEYLCWECHQEFGELVADAWNLPATLKKLVSDHHRYPAADHPLRTERLLVHLTDMTNALLGYSPACSYDLLGSRAARDLRFPDQADIARFLADLPAQIEDACTWF